MKNFLLILFSLIYFASFGQSGDINIKGTQTNIGGDCIVTDDLTYRLRHCEYTGNIISYTPDLTEGVWFKMSPGWAVDEDDDITAVLDSVTIITPGGYWSMTTISWNGGNGNDFEVGLFKNNVLIKSIHRSTTGANNNTGGTLAKYLDGLVAGDDLCIKIRNNSDSTDPTIIGIEWYVRKEY